MVSCRRRNTGMDQFKIKNIHDGVKLWLHCFGLRGNSHWKEHYTWKKTCEHRTDMHEEAPTRVWAGVAFNRGLGIGYVALPRSLDVDGFLQ
eukprot:11007157-Karenia_brevis.AAC.1